MRRLLVACLVLLLACAVDGSGSDASSMDTGTDVPSDASDAGNAIRDVSLDMLRADAGEHDGGVPEDARDGGGPLGVYGAPWTTDSLANLEVGSNKQRTVDYRIRAEHSGAIDEATVFFIFGEGYGAGDGGDVLIEVRADDGSAMHLPSDEVLGSALVMEPMATNYPRLTFDPPIPVEAGGLYHLQFSNVGDDPVANYVSTDELGTPVQSPQQPTISDESLACLYSDDDGETWIHNLGHTPIYSVHYQDGASQGVGYINPRSQSGLRDIGDAARVRMRFTVSTQDRVVVDANVRIEGAGELTVRLEEGDGTLIEEGVVSRATADRDWMRYTFTEARRLRVDETYNLVFSSAASNFQMFGMTDGEPRGFDPGSVFSDGRLEYTEGEEWTADGTDAQFYFRTGALP